MRHQGCCRQFTELQLGLDTEQGGTTANKRRTSRHAHITSLDILDDLVLLAFIGEFEVLAVEIKGGSGIVRHIEAHLITHRSGDSGLNLLVKVKIGLTAL